MPRVVLRGRVLRGFRAFAFALLAEFVVFGLIVRTAQAADRRPNLLFIFSDDHAAQSISCYGSKLNRTPHLDRIAAGGMLFRNCFCTNSVCGPSRAVVLTGKYSHLNGFYRNGDRFDGTQSTMPKLLQQAGYQTAIVGKWHLESAPTGFDYHQILIGQGCQAEANDDQYSKRLTTGAERDPGECADP